MARPHVTARCEEDLDALPPDEAGALLDKFIEQRAHVPEAGDLINDLRDRPCYSLHAGRYRAATWYDAERDVVWLLAAGMHRSGSRDDFYNLAVRLEQAGRLYPTAGDYVSLADEERRDRIAQEAIALRQLCEGVVAAPEAGMHTYTSDDGLYAEAWGEAVDDLAIAVIRIRLLRLSGQWLTETELALLLAGAIGANAREEPDPDWLFRRFEEYSPLPPAPRLLVDR